ncbi:hypothetical protein [Devosia sp. XK-2]|uniref:hypothetical protein n=1 Tax=Devosia sp. XK-2 TaxID=3126689 RepID=UPI0030D17B73
MKKTLTLLVASTVLTIAIGVPAWSAMRAPTDGAPRSVATLFDDGPQTMSIALVGDDEDDDRPWQNGSPRGHDDAECGTDGDGDEDSDDDDNNDCRGGLRNPAPAGIVAPPQNGLFRTGAPPQVQMN